jgi:nicotinamide riboside kinase
MMPVRKCRSFLIEGPDRLGKSTLIDALQQELGFFQVVHYEKPKYLLTHRNDAMALRSIIDSPADEAGIKSTCYRRYQIESFLTMFAMLSTGAPFIMDRAHLGEMVYAPRYRGYNGNYVLSLEHSTHSRALRSNTRSTIKEDVLILLTTSDFSFIVDDGLSFDFSAKEEEQADFIKAFNASSYSHKLCIDVHDGHGAFKRPTVILSEVLQFLESIDRK